MMPYYKYFQNENIKVFIDLNKRALKPELRTGFHLDDDGFPVYPLGKRMNNDGTDYDRMRSKFICPLRTQIDKVRLTTCNASPTVRLGGCCIILATNDNPRYFTIPARGSSE